ncbi:MAG TPA: hypothetical protein VL147_12075 [Devosia sp.]|nr:hypothetical protein [Devosia sp.]
MNALSEREPVWATSGGASQWAFTGDLRSSARFNQRCSACSRQDLRLTFEVRHETTQATCRICQNCISRGSVAVEQAGRILHGQELRDHITEMAIRVMVRTCREVLRNLLAGKIDNDLLKVAVYFDRNAQLSPRHAATLFLALSDARVGVDAKIFEVHIRSTDHREEFGRLNEREKVAVWQVLSPTVRKRLIALKLAPERYFMQAKRTKQSRDQYSLAALP